MRYKRTGRKAFTLVEIMIALAVVGVLFGLIFAFYRSAIDKSKYVEAVATVDSIGKAEEINQMNTGEYVAADNTQEVNEKLGLNIESKGYNYKVVGVTNDNFIVLAEKILDDINNGNLSTEPTVIAKNNSGPVAPESVPESTPGAPPGETSPESPTGGGGTPGGGGSPGGNNPEPPVATPAADQTGGGSSRTLYPSQSAVSADTINLLDNTIWGQWAYDLIKNDSIKVVYVNMADYDSTGALAFWWGIYDHVETINREKVFVTGNTIFIDYSLLPKGYTATAIASIITHEANHADYAYHPQEYIEATLAAHHELSASDIHIPGNSIDQEYQGFNKAVNVWKEIKSATDTNDQMDFWAGLQATNPPPPLPPDGGEAAMKAEVRALYGVNPPDVFGLPEY